jgi:non-canonical purine NTP pyrophosphatase (RdgB/HAM1 family)
MEKIKFVSTNRDKAKVLERCLAAVGQGLERVELPITEPQGSTVEAVARDKARQAFALIGTPCVVEDSGLCVDALGGFPGPMTKYALETIGVAGLLRLVSGLPSRTSRFVGALVYMDANGVAHPFLDEQAVGTLAHEADGTRCDGAWSPLWGIFVPEGASAPLSALSPAERDALWARWQSHSVYAQFARWLSQPRQ